MKLRNLLIISYSTKSPWTSCFYIVLCHKLVFKIKFYKCKVKTKSTPHIYVQAKAAFRPCFLSAGPLLPPPLSCLVMRKLSSLPRVSGRKIKTLHTFFIAIYVTVILENFLKNVQICHCKVVLQVFLVAFENVPEPRKSRKKATNFF